MTFSERPLLLIDIFCWSLPWVVAVDGMGFILEQLCTVEVSRVESKDIELRVFICK